MLWGPRCQARLLNSRLAQGDQRKYRNFAEVAHGASTSILTRKGPSRGSDRQSFRCAGLKRRAPPPCTPRDPAPLLERTYLSAPAARRRPVAAPFKTHTRHDVVPRGGPEQPLATVQLRQRGHDGIPHASAGESAPGPRLRIRYGQGGAPRGCCDTCQVLVLQL